MGLYRRPIEAEDDFTKLLGSLGIRPRFYLPSLAVEIKR